MVTRMWFAMALFVALVGCFDPTLPPECRGAVCGAVMDPPPEGGASAEGAAGMVGGGGPGGMGGGGGAMGGMGGTGGIGGAGGAPTLSITIVSPTQGAMLGHGQDIDFIAEVVGGTPANDQIVWTKNGVEGSFGIGYQFTRAIPAVAVHQLTVSVMEGDNAIASDQIQFETQ